VRVAATVVTLALRKEKRPRNRDRPDASAAATMRQNGAAPSGCPLVFSHAVLLLTHLESPNLITRCRAD